MRTELEILADQEKELQYYRKDPTALTPDELAAHNARMKALRDEMRLLYIDGVPVHDFIAEYAEAIGVEDPTDLLYASKSSPSRFEIAVDIDGVTFRARGFDKADALTKWIAKEWYWSPAQIASGKIPEFMLNGEAK